MPIPRPILRPSPLPTAVLTVLVTAALLLAAVVAPPVAPRADAVMVRTAPTPVPARPADSLVEAFGVQTHLGYRHTPYTDVARTKEALVRLGVRHVRDNLYSGRPEMYAAMREIAAAGIRFNLIMGIPQSWDTPARLVQTIKEHLATGVVESLEGANEWNLRGGWGWVGELRAHQKRLWQAAKAEPVTADLPILAPSLGQRAGYRQLGNLSNVADIGNAHNYPGGLEPSAFIEEVTAEAERVVGGKPVMFTESGYHNAMNGGGGHRPTLEPAAGEYAPRLLLEHFLRGTERLYLYELLDQRHDPKLRWREANFGLLRNDFTPKPAYLALRNLLRLAADPGPQIRAGSLAYEVQRAPDDLRQVLLQKRDGTFLLLLWRDVSLYDRIKEALFPVTREPVTVRLADPADLAIHEPSQSASPVATGNGTSTGALGLDGSVVAVEIRPHRVTRPALDPAGRDTTPVRQEPSEPRQDDSVGSGSEMDAEIRTPGSVWQPAATFRAGPVLASLRRLTATVRQRFGDGLL